MERDLTGVRYGPSEPALSWSAVFGGVATALAVGSVLNILGAGFGFRLATPGASGDVGGFTPVLGAAMVTVQVVSNGLGGYLAGRLRHAWADVHVDEAHFRDTAHGLVVWAVVTVISLTLAAAMMGSEMHMAANAATAATATPAPTAAELQRQADIASQLAFFTAVGLFLSAFIAAVAARLGGMQGETLRARTAVRT